ncbi:MAG: glycerophosphodiester phosphodiesterase [Fimbriimonas sp.]
MLLVAALAFAAQPLIIAHRGASALRPEHTLEAYRLAIEAGADYIETDLVITKDGILLARNENELSATTNVADIAPYASRRTTKTIDGGKVTGWFTEDFTLSEIKLLRAKERLPELRPGNKEYDGKFDIPTFSQVVELAKNAKRKVGVYAETKHPAYFKSIGLPLEPALFDVLKRHGWSDRNSRVFIQSFEPGSLWALNRQIDVPLVQLLAAEGRPYDLQAIEDERTYADLAKPEGLRFIKTYADVIGVEKGLLIPRDGAGNLGTPTTLVTDARKIGLKVHAWTFRDEDAFLPKDLQGKPQEEMKRYLDLGLDGIFTDNPATVARPSRP